MAENNVYTQLYERMFEEQERFREWLLAQPPSEILNHSYEYSMREDILMAIEYSELEEKHAKALLDGNEHCDLQPFITYYHKDRETHYLL